IGIWVISVFRGLTSGNSIDQRSRQRKFPLSCSMPGTYIGERRSGFVFQSGNGTMLWPSTVFRDGLSPVIKAMGRNRVRFHAFRRFRETTLQRSEVRQILIDYWM